jgi:hypothetical protein
MWCRMTDRLIRSSADWIAIWRARIADLELSLEEVDSLAGLSEGHTSKILCGKRKPKGETIASLCAALALSQSVSVDMEREAVLRAEATKRKRA